MSSGISSSDKHQHGHHPFLHHEQQQSSFPSTQQYRTHGTSFLSNDGPYFFRSLIWGLYKNSEYTDFTIRIKGSEREFHVHRAVICPQSEIFEAACRGSFIEASTNSMTLVDDDAEIVERMIRYLYTHRYDDVEDWRFDCCDSGIKRIRQHYSGISTRVTEDVSDDETTDSHYGSDEEQKRMLRRARRHGRDIISTCREQSSPSSPPKSLYVYAIADKYLIYPLKELARTRFTSWVYSHWWTRGFVAAAREIFENETGNYTDLKEVILSTITLHADTLLCRGNSIGSNSPANKDDEEYDVLSRFMHDYNEVGIEVLRRTLDRTRVRQRGLEVDIADLESRVNALRVENKKIAMLQSRNNSLNRELLDIRMVVCAWKRDLKSCSSGRSVGSSAGQSGTR